MNTATLISLISLASGFLFAALTLLYTVRHFKLSRTVSYIERMNTPEMARIRGEIDKWLASSDDEEILLSDIAEDQSLSANVRVFMNIITELGIAYEAGLVNKTLVHRTWYPLIPNYSQDLRFYVYEKRRSGYQVGHYLEMMALKIDDYAQRKNLAQRYEVPYLDQDALVGEGAEVLPTHDGEVAEARF